MRKAVFILLALAVGAWIDPVPEALADGIAVVRPAKKPRAVYRAPRCPHDRCGYPIKCPDGTCSSLYGAYGPYGGVHYWSRYSYGGWGHRW
jgi:hypothetical protein